MENNNQYESIHRFLLGDMDQAEKVAFENELNSSNILKQKLETEKRFFEIVDYASDADLKNTISTVHNELKEKGFFENQQTGSAKIVHLKDRKYTRVLMAIAAIAAILIASWFVFNWKNKSNIDTNAVFANYYKPESNLAMNYLDYGFTGEENSPARKLHIAIDHYLKKEYEVAQNILIPLHEEVPENNVVTFYLSLVYLELDDASSTILLLEPIRNVKSELTYPINWYLGLAYLKNNEQKRAISIFEDLSENGDNEYREKASLILTELK